MQWEGLGAVGVYFLAIIGIGIYFFSKSLKNDAGEKEYFLGGRSMKHGFPPFPPGLPI